MRNEIAKIADQVQVEELELLTDLLLVWCEKNDRKPEDLLPHCSLILERYRSGAYTADKLFAGL